MKTKKFLDTVHGYITIPETYCDELIDTAHFQRLRRIEQSSARSLFACARHDRFVHSLGVYHMGQRLLSALFKDCRIKSYIMQRKLHNTYGIACLLHDCGHSPFSHTLEKFFGKEILWSAYVEEMKKKGLDVPTSWSDGSFSPNDTKEHEIISAYLCLTIFYDKIKKLEGDPVLVGRMIMGLEYNIAEKSLEDCMIALVNGDVIDADRLDYICRDQWALGYLSYSVDVDRLIDGIKIRTNGDGSYQVVYKKNAVSEIQAVIDSKNFQTVNVFHHHQVIYEQELFKQCIRKLVEKMNPANPQDMSSLFDFKTIVASVGGENRDLYLLSDDDIVHLMKVHLKNETCFCEWLSRSYEKMPIWKSRAEFIALFKEVGGRNILTYSKKDIFEDVIIPVVKRVTDEDYQAESVKIAMSRIKPKQIFIEFDKGTVVDFVDLNIPKQEDVYRDEAFFYIYVPKSLGEEGRLDIIKEIKVELSKLKIRGTNDISENGDTIQISEKLEKWWRSLVLCVSGKMKTIMTL